VAADPEAILSELSPHDLSLDEIRRQVGGITPHGNDTVRQRFAALLDPSAQPRDDTADSTAPSDPRLCGALINRLGGTATTTVISSWMGWTVERTNAAIAQLDRRLDSCGLRLVADTEGHLEVRERARLRVRPRQLPVDLLAHLDHPAYRHALAHLVRGEHCGPPDWMQPLLDLGVAIPSRSPGIYPTDKIAPAFAAAARRPRAPRPTGMFFGQPTGDGSRL
jgi:hypothetical protein